MKKIIITIELIYDDATASDDTKTATIDPDQPYWQDEMDDMMDDYD